MLHSPTACSYCRFMHPAACSVHAQCCKFLHYVTSSCTLRQIPCTMQQVPASCRKFLHPAASSCPLLQVPPLCCKFLHSAARLLHHAATFLHPAASSCALLQVAALSSCTLLTCTLLQQENTYCSGVITATIWCKPNVLVLLLLTFGAHLLLWRYS